MPVHDWSKIEAGFFHALHVSWIVEIARTLNLGVLPADYYALPEQHSDHLGPDVLTLKGFPGRRRKKSSANTSGSGRMLLLEPPPIRMTAQTDLEYYRRKQNVVAVRHVSDDEVVAVIEIVSRANKAGKGPLESFINKATYLLEREIHLLLVDLQAPTKRDPNGIHGAIWEQLTGDRYRRPASKPLTQVAYECSGSVAAYVKPMAVGDRLTEMPLFLKPGAHVLLPLEATYQTTFASLPDQVREKVEGAE